MATVNGLHVLIIFLVNQFYYFQSCYYFSLNISACSFLHSGYYFVLKLYINIVHSYLLLYYICIYIYIYICIFCFH